MNLIVKCVIFSIVSFIVSSCSVNNVDVGEIQKLNIVEINKNSIKMRGEIIITNNSILPFTIQSGELKAFSGETEIGTANLVEKLYIKSKKSKTYPFSIILTLTNHEESMNLLLNSLLGKKSTYLIKGTVNASSFYFFKKKIIINQTFLK